METWNDAIGRMARNLGVSPYNGGPLEITFDGAPKICVELIDGGAALVAHADLGALHLAPDGGSETLERLLAANAPQYVEAGAVAAIDSVTGSCLLFRRFEDAEMADDVLAEELRQFAEAVKFKQAELRNAGDDAGTADADTPFSANSIRV